MYEYHFDKADCRCSKCRAERVALHGFDPDEPRDADGKWSGGGAAGGLWLNGKTESHLVDHGIKARVNNIPPDTLKELVGKGAVEGVGVRVGKNQWTIARGDFGSKEGNWLLSGGKGNINENHKSHKSALNSLVEHIRFASE
jgi:hypothetical protein